MPQILQSPFQVAIPYAFLPWVRRDAQSIGIRAQFDERVDMSDMTSDMASGSVDIAGDGTAQVFFAHPIPLTHDCRWEGRLVVLASNVADVDDGANVRIQLHGKRKSGTSTLLSADVIGTAHGWAVACSIDGSQQLQATIVVPNGVDGDVDFRFEYEYQSP